MNTLYDIYYRLKFIITGDCSHGCHFSENYGCYVPEADCPVHDSRPLKEMFR